MKKQYKHGYWFRRFLMWVFQEDYDEFKIEMLEIEIEYRERKENFLKGISIENKELTNEKENTR